MVEIHDSSKAQQIKAFLLVFGSGIFAAFLLCLGLLYYYNPSGSYLAKNTLLDPAAMETWHFNQTVERGKDNSPFILNGIEFSYYDSQAKRWKNIPVDQTKYGRFYQLTSNDKSIDDLPDDIKSSFGQGHPSSLTLKTKRESSSNVADPFIKVDFSENGDFYRIQLRQHGQGQGWAYFHHQGIFKQATHLFGQP